MAIKIYEYEKCDTCRKALKWLDKNGKKFEKIAIVEKPPTMAELRKMLKHLKGSGGTFKNLFNTSGVQYRELKIGDRLKAGMSEDEGLELLSKNGKLIKRPFVLSPNAGSVGFKEDVWKKLF